MLDGRTALECLSPVKFLTDHLRSLIRHAVKQLGVEGFYDQSAAVLRDVVLGKQDEAGKRPGRRFDENGMHVYDVEVLDVTLGDGDIAQMLLEAQHATVRQALSLAAERRKLELTRETEATRRIVSELQSGTRLAELALRQTEHTQTQQLRLAETQSEAALEAERKAVRAAEQSLLDLVHAAELTRVKSRFELDATLETHAQTLRLADLQAEVRAVVEKAQAVSPDLVAALQAFGDRALTAKVAESMAPLAILGGESVAAVLARLLQGTTLARLLPAEVTALSSRDEG